MIKAKPEHTGLNINRIKNNPMEDAFVTAWREFNKNHANGRLDYKHLIYLLSPNQPNLQEPRDRISKWLRP